MLKVDVPERISREAYVALVQSLGFGDASNLSSLEFRCDGIYAEVVVRDENGRARRDSTLGKVVEHRVFIPVVDGLE